MRAVLLLAFLITAPVAAEEIDAATLAQLKRDKVAYGTKSYRQLFDAYVAAKVPIFITSDTVLHAWHVLLERSIQRLERHRARGLATALQKIWDRLPKALSEFSLAEDLQRRALRRARLVLGVALALSGGELCWAPGPVRALIEAEAKRVTAARGLHKPEWLGPPEPDFMAIDYGDFRPRSFYDAEASLARAYRALRWLKVVPFFLDRDEDVAALHLISVAWGGASGVSAILTDGYEELAPVMKARTAAAFVSGGAETIDAKELINLRALYRAGIGSWRPWDLVAQRRPRPNLRILPTLRLPVDDLFEITALDGKRRPAGVEVCAALGSAWARGQLRLRGLEVNIKKFGPLDAGETIASAYYECLRALLDAPEPEAPQLFSQTPWTRKSCRTALGSWAQWRHTFALHASDRFSVFGIPKSHAGFVEPDPEFFGRLAALAERTRRWVHKQGGFGEALDRAEIATGLVHCATLIESGSVTRQTLPGLAHRMLRAVGVESRRLDDAKVHSDCVAALRRAAKSFEAVDRPLAPELREVLGRMRSDVEWRWKHLRLCCMQLEALAHKQLRGKDWNEREAKWIRDFGPTLGSLLFYDSTSWLYPNDDVPKATVVFRDPRRGPRLHVAIGRPRPIYVLYPWHGEEIRCRGAVLDYFEFENLTALTDKEFRERLDGADPPRPPAWLSGGR